MREALDIRVRGIVQGVGFRPFVYRLAKHCLVDGWVLNDPDGVLIHAEAETEHLDEFVMELAQSQPVAAKVEQIELTEVVLQDCTTFEIRESNAGDTANPTQISADLGICDDCARELLDERNRRFRYPFINCTNCGPRFTIISALPYDRANTSMRAFEMCSQCAREYADPADRRFHAQPDACFACGPELTWVQQGEDGQLVELSATNRETSDELLARAVELLASGGIVAVKGLGGFHLVCDAANEQAVARLRARKKRDGKPFAVMASSADDARRYCEVSAAEEQLLESPARPIVLLCKREEASMAQGLADELPELGVMLPATPVQVLLIGDFKRATGRDLLVMTSGNSHDEPIVIDDAQAVERLLPIADAILGNNRPILSRFDDSVLRVLQLGEQDAVQFLRRARGYAPVPLPVGYGTEGQQGEGEVANQAQAAVADAIDANDSNDAANVDAETNAEANANTDAQDLAVGARAGDAQASTVRERGAVLAVGPEQKNTLAFIQAGQAYVSQYIGDVEDADVMDAWCEAKDRLQSLFMLAPRFLACDAHPEYLTSKWARKESMRTGMPLTEVQHHHAHVASVLGEHDLYGPCCGIVFDGTGFGADGNIWGGEVLLANQVDYERFANLAYMPLPGGQAAIEHPARMAYGMLWSYDLLDHPAARDLLGYLGEQAAICDQMIERGLNTPLTSSMGRFFDGVSALLGVCREPTYEGEAAILLDACRADEDVVTGEELVQVDERYAFALQKNAATSSSTAHDTSVVLLDGESTLRAILDDLQAGVEIGVISLRFHRAVVGAISTLAELVRSMYDISLVAISGGCFMNRYLVTQATLQLGARGFTVALSGSLPPNDGCISYGQGVVASASR